MERGGYRLIRMLGGSGGDEVSLCAGPDHEPVVLRVVDEARADAAIAASAAQSPHLAPLLDLFSLPDERFGLVYPRLPGGALAQLLARRAEVRPGEATTILVSVARGLSALHSEGVVHGAVRTSGVLFDADGTPVLADLTACTSATAEGTAADLRAFATVAAAVLSRVPGSEVLLARVTAAGASLADVESALFESAEPRPVDLPPAESPTIEQLLPSRSSPPAAVPPPSPEGPTLARRGRELVAALRKVRPRVWVPAALVGACLIAALVLVPVGGSEAGTAPEATTPEGRAGGRGTDADWHGGALLGEGTYDPVQGDDPAEQGADPAVEVDEPAGADPAVQGDDPAAAALALARARDGCLAHPVDGCLEHVDQPGSTLLEHDRAGIGPPPPTIPDPEAAATVQRAGDAALVTVGDVRVLLVRVEKEWRLRDLFAAEPLLP